MRVEVKPYDDAWPAHFRAEAARLAPLFGAELMALHHIGSTAVPGLAAKPVIDMMPVVRRIEAVDRAAPDLAAMGYEGLGENGLPGRRYFRKGARHEPTKFMPTPLTIPTCCVTSRFETSCGLGRPWPRNTAG